MVKRVAEGAPEGVVGATPAPVNKKQRSAVVPTIHWTANNSHHRWQLITEAEKEPNRVVLLGPKKGQVCALILVGYLEAHFLAEYIRGQARRCIP